MHKLGGARRARSWRPLLAHRARRRQKRRIVPVVLFLLHFLCLQPSLCILSLALIVLIHALVTLNFVFAVPSGILLTRHASCSSSC